MGADAKTGWTGAGVRRRLLPGWIRAGSVCVLARLQAYMCLRVRGCMSRAESRLGWGCRRLWLPGVARLPPQWPSAAACCLGVT